MIFKTGLREIQTNLNQRLIGKHSSRCSFFRNIEWFDFELVGLLNKTLINPDPLHTSSVLLLQVLQW